MTDAIKATGGYEPPKPTKRENIFEATARRKRERAAKDPAYAELEKMRASTDFGTQYLEEGG